MSLTNDRNRNSVLVLEDDTVLASALRDFFEDEGWQVEIAATAAEAHSKLAENVFDLVLADYLLPDANGLSVFPDIQLRSPLTKVMVMTGVRDMEVAAQAFKKGAADLISKPFELGALEQRIDRLMEQRRLQVESEMQKSQPKQVRAPNNTVGESAAIKKVFQLIHLVAPTNATILITGESGTGKELVGHAIHAESERRSKPFIAIHCGAIPENLLEDDLFGHVRGAYTDARETRIGKFEQANGGTLFLDEIGAMSHSLQVKLLRVLEEKEFEKLGSNETIRVDVRIVAATNADLREKVNKGEFRVDLFYRLNVVPIHVPPLRQRKEDIPLLVSHFLRLCCREYNLPNKAVSPAALKALMQYHWPGNIRELRNVLELATVLSGERAILDIDDLPKFDELNRVDPLKNYLCLPEEGIDLKQAVNEMERNLIAQSLERTGGNKGEAARLLYLKRTTLVEKLRRLDLLRKPNSH